MKYLLLVGILLFGGCAGPGKSSPKAGPERWIAVDRVTIYAKPSTTARVAGHLRRGQRVLVGKTQGSWSRLESGGWLSSSALGTKRPKRP